MNSVALAGFFARPISCCLIDHSSGVWFGLLLPTLLLLAVKEDCLFSGDVAAVFLIKIAPRGIPDEMNRMLNG